LSPSEAVNDATRSEWRELGFYYETQKQPPCWRFVGSRSGLSRLVELLEQYVTDPRNAQLSEHEHFGPYMYLKVQTAERPEIDEESIRGTLPDLARLRDLIAAGLRASAPGKAFLVGAQYSPAVTHPLRFEVQAEGFDPASADPALSAA
jgi:hypothetical protein